MLNENILETAQHCLKNRQIKDIVAGVSLIAVELDHGAIGVSYVLRETLPGGCSAFPYVRDVVGCPASDVAEWIVKGDDDLQRAIGNAVINGAAPVDELDESDTGTPFGLDLNGGEKVAMVGMIPPAIMMLKPYDCEFIVFDRGKDDDSLYPVEKQKEMIPRCDIAFLSGTTTVNRTADDLLEMCDPDAQVVMIGSSTPLYPKAFKGTPVKTLAGSLWDPSGKEDLFRLISMASGIDGIRQYMIKKNIVVRK